MKQALFVIDTFVTSVVQILDFWLTRNLSVSAKSQMPDQLKLRNRVRDIKCLFYYLKILEQILNFEKKT